MNYPKAAILSILILVTFESLFLWKAESLSGIPVFQPTIDDALSASKRSRFYQAKQKVVLLGDSSALTGLIPEVLASESGYSFLNLGMLSSMTTVGFSDMGTELLNNPETRPAAIVYAILPQSLEVTAEEARSFGFLGRYLIAYNRKSDEYSPSFKDYQEWFIKKHRFNVFPNGYYGDGVGFDGFDAYLKSTDGFMPEVRKYSGAKKVKLEFTPDPFSVDAITRIIQVAKKHEVPLVLLLNPKPYDSISEEYSSAVSEWIERYNQGDSIEFQYAGDLFREPELFGTETHLTESAARRYSTEIGRLLQRELDL